MYELKKIGNFVIGWDRALVL